MRKNRMQGLFHIVLICVFGILLVACGKKEEKEKAEEPKEEKKSSEIAIEVPPVSIDGILYGMVVKKEEKALSVQSDRGKTVRLPLDEKTDLREMGEGLVIGAAVRVEYEGKLKKAGKKKLKILKILPSEKPLKLSAEAAELCANLILCFETRDLETLSTLCDYPLIVDRGEKKGIESPEEFLALKQENIFEGELVRHISSVNPFMLAEYSDGFLLGESMPNLIISNTKKGWKLSAFHYK